MKNVCNFFAISALAIIICLFFSACIENPDKPTVSNVTVSPRNISLFRGEKTAFTAKVNGTNNPAQTVIWSIDESEKNINTIINSSGELTIADDEKLISIKVRATSNIDLSKSGTAKVNITSPPFNDISASEIVSDIKLGVNLGNTLDTTGISGQNPAVAQYETAWGNPVTTQEIIDTYYLAGFNAIRICVTWYKCVDKDYNIRKDWMARVTEVVNYAVNNNMYILLNSHHDESIFKFTAAAADESKKAFKKIWEQIAENFKNYDEKLIFEALNEPRTISSKEEWNGGTVEERNILNEHYQIFVDTVRASGGNNAKRVLLINSYAASGLAAALNNLAIPVDTVQNKIIVSYHAYEPYNFALNKDTGSVSTWDKSKSGDITPITERVDRAYANFVSKGIPVLIGEFGALNKNNEAARAAWAEYYTTYARSKNIPCFWWDDGGDFKLLNRRTLAYYYPAIVTGLKKGAYGQ